MSNPQVFTFNWKNNSKTLVFEITILPGNPPEAMELVLNVLGDTDPLHDFYSADSEIILNVIIGGSLLTGKLSMKNVGPDHGYVFANLGYGVEPGQQFEGAMIKYPFTPTS